MDELFREQDRTSAAHRGKDWSRTSLGPVDGWPGELRAAIRTVMPSRVPMLLWWGGELVQIFNDTYTPLLGDKFPAAVGQPAAECWAEVWEELAPLAEQALAGTATYSENQRLYLRRHGYLEETHWTFSYSPVRGEDGSVAGIFVATTDVTARVVGDRRLEILRRLGTLSVAAAGSPEDACRAALDVLSGSPEDLPFVSAHLCTSAGLTGLGPAGADDGTLEVVRRVLATGRGEHVRLAGDGPAVVTPLVAGAREPVGALVIGVSPYREYDDQYASFVSLVASGVATAVHDAVAYAEERERVRALAELHRAKSRLIQNVSHEFRTPLTLLLAPLRSLLDEYGATLPADQRGALSAAHRVALRLRRMVDALLDVVRAEAGELRACPEATDVAVLTEDTASMFRAAAEAAGLALVIDVAPVTAELDQEMWVRIVLNLVSNAIKFTPAGTVTVTLRAFGDDLVLTVADTGVGIARAEQDRIFERFYQVETGGGRGREGIGIGLSLVSDLTRALGGQVTVTGAEQEGSTFTVTVPHVRPCAPTRGVAIEDLAAPYVDEAGQWAPASVSEAGDGERRILLVEDNADLRDYLVRLLEEQRWAVQAVADAETALAVVAQNRPDLVLSDVMLPCVDGLTLVRRLRADALLARLPVVLLTARAGSESAVEGFQHGADDYVVKPFHPAELVARVRVHLELAKFREALIAEGENQVSSLRAGMNTRSLIGQAVGIVMATQRCDAASAYQRLVRTSQRTQRKVRDIAADLVGQYATDRAGMGKWRPHNN